MPLLVNLRQLEKHNLALRGELAAAELEIQVPDELVQANEPLIYELEAQWLEDSLLIRGKLAITLDCECVRCLKPFKYKLVLPHFAAHVPVSGDEAIPVSGDCVDLTPILREDTLLEFPQHPLCEPGCGGLPDRKTGKKKTNDPAGTDQTPSTWSALDKLKL
jgi:uncharacterized protein